MSFCVAVHFRYIHYESYRYRVDFPQKNKSIAFKIARIHFYTWQFNVYKIVENRYIEHTV